MFVGDKLQTKGLYEETCLNITHLTYLYSTVVLAHKTIGTSYVEVLAELYCGSVSGIHKVLQV